MSNIFDFVSKNPELSSILMAFFFSSLGYFVKVYFDKKEKLRMALYILLEVWNQVVIFRRINSFDAGSILNDLFRELFPGIDVENEIPAEIKTVITTSLLKAINSDDGSETIIELKREFSKAIHSIASYDPILAYKINNINILGMLNGATVYYNSVNEIMTESCSAEILADISSIGKEFAFDEVLSELENDIRSLALEISPFAYFAVIKTTNKMKRDISFDTDDAQEIIGRAKAALTNLMQNEAARVQADQ